MIVKFIVMLIRFSRCTEMYFRWVGIIQTFQRLTEYGIETIGGQNRVGRENYTECWKKEGRVKRSHVTPPETDAGTLLGKSQPHGDTQINRNGFN